MKLGLCASALPVLAREWSILEETIANCVHGTQEWMRLALASQANGKSLWLQLVV